MAPVQYTRSGTHWYVGDGFIWDDLPVTYRTHTGRPLECSSQLLIYNPQPETATVTVRFFHIDRSPTLKQLDIAGGSISSLELATLAEIPHKQAFWITLESNIPVLPQARHEDYSYWDPVPDALIAPTPYPGPLSDETTWIFPDCYQGGPQSWYERELLTILNPSTEPVKVHVQYLLRNNELGAEEYLEIAPERVAALDIWERSPRLLGNPQGPVVRVQHDYAVRIDAEHPVIAQTTRRARWTGRPSIVGARSITGFPLRAADHTLWHYPGGMIVDRGVLPHEQNFDVTWNLLFTHNLHTSQPALATLTIHSPEGIRKTVALRSIAPQKSHLEWMHLQPWLGDYTHIDVPFAMTVASDSPVVPEVTGAEFEMWSQMCPGAMSAVNFYPGPLTDECAWWLGIAPWGGADDRNVEWSQQYHLLNTSEQPIVVELIAYGLDTLYTHQLTLPAQAVALVDAQVFSGLPIGIPYAVFAKSAQPFCAQVFVRTFTRGLASTRGMYSCMGVPMALR